MDNRISLVYVSGQGRIKETTTKPQPPAGDGVVRILLKRLGGNKAVSIISGLSVSEDDLKSLCSELKRKCANMSHLAPIRSQKQKRQHMLSLSC